MVICDKCGKAFLLKAYRANHVCSADDVVVDLRTETEKEADDNALENKSKKELVELAKDAGITGSDRMKKEEIIEALK